MLFFVISNHINVIFRNEHTFMKRIISLFLFFTLSLAFFEPTLATQDTVSNEEFQRRQVEVSDCPVTVNELVTKRNQVIRTYRRTENANAVLSECNSEIDRTRSILFALSNDWDVVNSVPDNTLLETSNCEEITTATSYVKQDADGNVTYLSERQIYDELATYVERPEDIHEGMELTEYMKIVITVYYYGDALYEFTSYAKWLTMPIWRLDDSLGLCAPTLAILNSTRNGYYTYETHDTENGEMTITETREEITLMMNKQEGDWYGSVGIFNLPNDLITDLHIVQHFNFKAYYEFKAYLRYPSLQTNFNTVATYCHKQVMPMIEPTVSIDFSGTVSAEIGIGVLGVDERISAEIFIRYYP